MAKLIKNGVTILFQNGTDVSLERQKEHSKFGFTYYDVNVTIKLEGQTLFNGAIDSLSDSVGAPFTRATLQTFVGDFSGGSGGTGIITLVPLTDAVNIDWVLDTNAINTVTLAGNRTLDNPDVLTVGSYVLYVIQDAIGSRTLSYGTNFRFSNNNPPVLSTAPNAVDILTFVCDGVSIDAVKTPNFL